MKAIVIYYSRGGHVRKIAEEIAAALPADIDEIVDLKKRDGIVGWLSAGRDATLRKNTEISVPHCDVSAYDLVIIGTPIWSWNMACGVRSFLMQYGAKMKQVAFFAAMGGSGDKRAFAEMQKMCGDGGIVPVATAAFLDSAIKDGKYKGGVEEFVRALRKVMSS